MQHFRNNQGRILIGDRVDDGFIVENVLYTLCSLAESGLTPVSREMINSNNFNLAKTLDKQMIDS